MRAFFCAPAQVIVWKGPSATTPSTSSLAHDPNCGRNTATSEFHCAQPRRVTKKWCWTPLSATKGALSIRTYPGNWVGWPVPFKSPRRFLRKRPFTTTSAPATPLRGTNLPHCQSSPAIRCWTPMRAPKGALSLRTYPGSWVGRAVRHNTTPLDVFRGAQNHAGDVVAVSGGTRTHDVT